MAGVELVTRSENDWDSSFRKADKFVAELNITEKIRLATGALGDLSGGCVGNISPIERLNFSALCLQDDPQAMNRADLVSIFPSGLTMAASWDRQAIFQRRKALGAEFRGKGAHVFLGPVAGALGRHPLAGRNWESFSPDPYLTGIAMDATIRGVQSEGVQTCSKHYVGNDQETQRTNTFLPDGTEIEATSSNIDDRTLHELYVWPFADAVKAGTTSVMCSYNRVNQTYACENERLLNGILKTELGFQGYIMSDWFATHSGPESMNAGLDMNMPGAFDQAAIFNSVPSSYWGSNITKYLDEGAIKEHRLDDMIRRIMAPYYHLGQDKPDFPSKDPTLVLSLAASSGVGLNEPDLTARDVRGNHGSLIRRIGAEATILLKNTKSTLPLKSPKNIGVFGNDAVDPIQGLAYHESPYEIGTIDIGGGSGTGRHSYLVSPLEAIRARSKKDGARLQHIIHNKALAADDFIGMYPVPDVCLVFIGTFASESWDRTDYEADWNSTLVVQNVAKRCPNTIVITHSAGANTMPWANNPNVTAILAAHLPGQESGNSIVDVLWGDVNPSGRLPYTIPVNKTDYNISIVNLTEAEVTSPTAWQAHFTEGQMIDYRYYDHYGIEPLYEFGFGLSYTTFKLSKSLNVVQLKENLRDRPRPSERTAPGGNPELWEDVVRVDTEVANTGKVVGAAVPQLYLSFPQKNVPTGTPAQILRGFDKVTLQPGESRRVSFTLRRRDLSYWDVERQNWVIPKGAFTFKVGFSSRDISKAATKTLRP
ncbi:glycosyl hydrolase family 3 N terminal domain-containing protein [Fusarium solani]|uniref:Beta-glucosidase cel3A n=1 Tax=Fusarium solani TaxID=169388 RepID=A0A9P9H021_FUSSL|nr:glycosyl hydrolase family 3 N terminal domain-containing protein [Fusarium solani]KAH7248226.1 glycosyl hydrolase family 3 N terminal domain-containing protein [Fusarium solani]